MRIVIQNVRGDTAARARLLPPGYREREGLAGAGPAALTEGARLASERVWGA